MWKMAARGSITAPGGPATRAKSGQQPGQHVSPQLGHTVAIVVGVHLHRCLVGANEHSEVTSRDCADEAPC